MPGTVGPTGASGLQGAKGMEGSKGYRGTHGQFGEDVSKSTLASGYNVYLVCVCHLECYFTLSLNCTFFTRVPLEQQVTPECMENKVIK